MLLLLHVFGMTGAGCDSSLTGSPRGPWGPTTPLGPGSPGSPFRVKAKKVNNNFINIKGAMVTHKAVKIE